MLGRVISRVLDTNKRELDRLERIIAETERFAGETKKAKLPDFRKKTDELRGKVGKDNNLENVLPEAFAWAKEAAWRTLGLRAHDVQLMAGKALFEGKVVEQKTGEGKTLTAVFPLYVRSLAGKGAHLVTVNDYLARVGAGWNAPVYDLLGLSVGVIAGEQKSYLYDTSFSDKSHGDERLEHLKEASRKAAYDADITYGTNNEFGFDYLRDNMVDDISRMVQRGHYYAIVDEVDSVLIDEARTPLIISAPDAEPTSRYYEFAKMIDQLNADTDYAIDEKARAATLTEHGILRVEKIMGVDNLYEKDFEAIHHIENALRARSLYLRDQHYVIKDGQVIIVDEFTGRMMPGRRWSDGLHQSVEAKEGLVIQQESKTMATISFQNYFRMYENLSGMSATVTTEAEEFKKIYNLDVVAVPTDKPMIRQDLGDVVYKTKRAKYGAVVKEIAERSKKGQPVLVGTTSIEQNEIVDQYLKKMKVNHNVLNAKNHEREAMIIAEAGKPGSVTVATNMAGRGVDIVLGGAQPDREMGQSTEEWRGTKEYKKWEEEHKKVIKAGGLHVVGTERHESRRIDNQLRGRSGRQGDPGSSRFYLSLEDDLMRIFGGEQISNLMDRLKLPEDQPIENKLISRVIEQAQSKVEGFHFDIRKNLVEYDDVANQQREIIYALRARVLSTKNLKKEILRKLELQIDQVMLLSWYEGEPTPDYDRVLVGVMEIVPLDDGSREGLKKKIRSIKDKEELREFLVKVVHDAYRAREAQVGEEVMRKVERFAYLSSIDHLWVDHIDYIDSLRESIKLRAYGQRDPLVEFKGEAYDLFEALLDKINEELARRIFRIGVRVAPVIPMDKIETNVDESDKTGLTEPTEETKGTKVKGKTKMGRNDPCWCGSGKKWKKCHYPAEG